MQCHGLNVYGPCFRGITPDRKLVSVCNTVGVDQSGKTYSKAGALLSICCIDADLPSVCQTKLTHNREAQTAPTRRPAARCVQAVKGFEDGLALIGRNARSPVDDADLYVFPCRAAIELNMDGFATTVAYGVFDQVVQYLAQNASWYRVLAGRGRL